MQELIHAFKNDPTKRLSCFGYGKTTAAIAKRFGRCDTYDDKFDQKEAFGTNTLNPMADFDPAASSLEVVSPGIPPHNAGVSRAKNLISDYDLFADVMPFSVWISGTNGKTTTTQMVQQLLSERGSVMGGNIGTPAAELDETAPIWVLESSSFTLHYTNIAVPNIYLLLPITEDHTSWHGSFKAYAAAKLKPLAQMKEGELAIIPRVYEGKVDTDAFVVYYDNTADLADCFGIDTSKLKFNEPFLMDAVMALAVTKSLFNETDYDVLNAFKVDPHKLEEIRDAKGRLWVDDSKATNVDATIAGIKGYADYPIHIILGGDDKGADMKPLFEAIKDLDVTVYAIGANRSKLAELCTDFKLECVECGFLDIAVSRIAQVLDNKGVAVLSPAAASLDQFSSYKERGEKFQEAIATL
jgi:UDP-N-acetylmuramoylalanine--D-glutamate ligase